VVATVFAAATAFVVAAMARLTCSRWVALGIGGLYLTWINLFEGWGGQSPVFYNLFVALAALLTVSTVVGGPLRLSAVIGRGSIAMLLLGVALQTKYTVVFEGIALGLLWLWCAGRSSSWDSRSLLLSAALWVACAIAPTALAWSVYAAMGHSEAFVHANFLSIFAKQPEVDGRAALRLIQNASLISPLLCLAVLAGLQAWRQRGMRSTQEGHLVLAGVLWLLGALTGALVIGNFYPHYMLPIVAPVLFLVTLRVSQDRSGSKLVPVLFAVGLVLSGITFHRGRFWTDEGHKLYEVARSIDHLRGSGCIFVTGSAPPILYHLTKSCLPTRFVFPFHLWLVTESKSLGADATNEMEKVIASRPTVLVIEGALSQRTNIETFHKLRTGLQTHYRLAHTHTVGEREILVFARTS
jgi:4-amino-4-deoxy-L-arabinose transferase-like glycosyltransferase